MKRLRGAAALALLVALAWGKTATAQSLMNGESQALAFAPGMVEPLRTAPEVALTTAEGAEFRLSQHRDEIVVIVFGYTRCPDVCAMTLARLAQLRAQLGTAAEVIRVVFVTLDPERDTAASLRAYIRAFDPTFVGLTGTPKALAQVRDAYGVVAGRRAAPGSPRYLVDHSTFVFVVDRAGQLRFMFAGGASVEDMSHGIAILLHEQPQSGPSRSTVLPLLWQTGECATSLRALFICSRASSRRAPQGARP